MLILYKKVPRGKEKMKILLGAGIIAGLLASASAQAQIVDLGIDAQTTENAKPSVDSLPEIKNLRTEKKAQQTQVKALPSEPFCPLFVIFAAKNDFLCGCGNGS